MSQPLDSIPINKDFNNFLSSYFSDLGRTVSRIRDLVLTLINVNIPSLPNLEIGSDMLSIVAACHKTFNDLKKVQSLLKGHVQAKSITNSQKSRVTTFSPIYQSVRNRNSSNSWSQGPHTPFFSMGIVKKSCDIPKTKQETATTFVSRYTDQQNKSIKDQNKVVEAQKMMKVGTTFYLDTSFRKTKESEWQKAANNSDKQTSSRVKSVEIAKKIEELRQIGSSQIKNFEYKNQECLGIIRQMKEEVKQKSSKLKKKNNNNK